MKKTLFVLALAASAALAQSVETVAFRAILSPQNEVPAVNIDAAGTATVLLHIVRGADGRVTSGSADFIVNYRLPGAITITGLHIHRGVAGANGPVVIDSAVPRIEDTTGIAGVSSQGQVRPDNETGLSAMTDILTNPAGFYVNLHTTANPGGVIRGQCMRADMRVFMSRMSGANEVPAVAGPASGVGSTTFIYTSRPDGTLTSASVTFEVNYADFPADTRFTGLHIHRGAAGANGPVTIDSGLRGQIAANQNGSGFVSFTNEVDFNNGNAVNTLYDLLADPSGHYLNLHTTSNPGGAVRGQLRTTSATQYQQTMLPSNEVPPVEGLDARAWAGVSVWAIRNAASQIEGAVVAFDVNHRFPGATTFTGLHIHNGQAGANGGVTVDGRITGAASVVSPSGFGNIYRRFVVSTAAGLATLNALTTDPGAGYLNLHTSVNPGGAVRAQVGTAITSAPSIETVISGVSDPGYRRGAPNGLVSIYGQNLTRVATSAGGGANADLSGLMNGTQVIIGNRAAALLSVSPRVIAAQLPSDLPAGDQPLYILAPNGTSNTVQVTIAANAPGVFFDRITAAGNAAVAIKASDFSFVTPDNAARAGESIWLITTGMGQTTPPLLTGVAATGTENRTLVPGVTIGGRGATVEQSYAWPGMVGMYLVRVRVPEGAGTGAVPLVVSIASNPSNNTVISLR